VRFGFQLQQLQRPTSDQKRSATSGDVRATSAVRTVRPTAKRATPLNAEDFDTFKRSKSGGGAAASTRRYAHG